MGKQGPCCHCGVTSTPLWRNGPPDKPVLCNACGSRWRTKGTLVNYTPTRTRDFEEVEVKPKPKFPVKIKNVSFKYSEDNKAIKRDELSSHGSSPMVLEGDTSSRSCSGSGSAISSESCVVTRTNDLTGSVQSDSWVSIVPSKKRTYVTRPTKQSPVEKLTQDLHSIMDQECLSRLSPSSDDDLLYPEFDSFETGYGSVLIRNINSNINSETVEEESEASSVPVNSKSAAPTVTSSFSNSLIQPDNLKRVKASNEKLVIKDRESPLVSIDLQDIINYDSFMKVFKHEDQQQLLKYLPSVDTDNTPESIEKMFRCKPFMDALSHFKTILSEGVLSLSVPGAAGEECRILKSLVLGNLTKSKWVEFYEQIKDKRRNQTRGKEPMGGLASQASIKRPRDKVSDVDGAVRSPCRARKLGPMNLPSHDKGHKFADGTPQSTEKKGVSCLISVPLHYEDGSDHDLLMDAPRNAPSPEAELLYNGPLKIKSLTNSSSLIDSEITAENSLSSHTIK
ncbi:hypothetical protein LUZ62_058355 [Rhynchospora pubera]|uniref:GATA transcription factor 26 n=1 Tax=Rhynchospora pubera TaxID=906938 RepID=A0AAV8E6N9_9POAL|nr:hypothetical protein LUZ62_058355 [Rhynchospora pubera]